jgi:MFS family permease
LIIGRFLSGLSAGGIFVLVPLYTSEISENQTRGTLGSFFIFAINLGTLLMFAVGAYLSYSISGILMLILPIVFVPMFYFLPETPQYLLKNGKIQEAEKSMKFLRGIEKSKETPDQIKKELLNLSQQNDENSENGKVSIIEELRRFFSLGILTNFLFFSINSILLCRSSKH